ncbi:MAG: Hpt domain-containing protein [Bacilli bacterium]|nr:Hpt domain-containing protein [Bacilli bacterium]
MNHTKEYLVSQGVDVDHGLELLGDMETYDMILEEFKNGYTDRVTKLKNYAAAGDLANYAIEAHAMKSDCKYLGFMTLADLAYQHEMAGKENRADFVNSSLESLLTEANRIITVVNSYFGE